MDTTTPESREYRAAKNEVALETGSVGAGVGVGVGVAVLLVSVALQELSELATDPAQTPTSSAGSRKRSPLERPLSIPIPGPVALMTGSVLKQRPSLRQNKHSSFMTHAVQFPVNAGQGSTSGGTVGEVDGLRLGRRVGLLVGESVASNICTRAWRPSWLTWVWKLESSRLVSRISS